MRVSHVATLVLALCCLPLLALGEPLDISDLSQRNIFVEVPGNALQMEASYGAKLVGGIPSATEGEVQITAAAYENYLQVVGDNPGGGTPVPGSFSDVTLVVDLASLEVDADPITGMVDIGVGPFADLTRTLGSGRAAGTQLVPTTTITVFCDGPTIFGPCNLVAGSDYNPATGEFTMVGDDTLVHPDITDPLFAKHFASNSFRLIEGPPPSMPPPLPTLGYLGVGVLVTALLGAWRHVRRPTRREH